jgi:hypothetical protein
MIKQIGMFEKAEHQVASEIFPEVFLRGINEVRQVGGQIKNFADDEA